MDMKSCRQLCEQEERKERKNLSQVKRRPEGLTYDDQTDNVTMMVTRVLPSA